MAAGFAWQIELRTAQVSIPTAGTVWQDQSRRKIIPEKGTLNLHLNSAAGFITLQSQLENSYRDKEKNDRPDKQLG